MDYNYDKIFYSNINGNNLNNIFVAYTFFGTVFYKINNNLYYLNLNDIDIITNELCNGIINVYNITTKFKKNFNLIDYNYIKNNYIYINLENNINININNTIINTLKYNYKIIICIFIDYNDNYNDEQFLYFSKIINQFNNYFIIFTIYSKEKKDLNIKIDENKYILIYINENNHMAGYLQSLNYIYYNKDELNYDYIFKLYYHENELIRDNILNMSKKMNKNNIIGYPNIKYDYLDSNYLYDIINIDMNINMNININENIYKNIKKIAEYNNETELKYKQINRKSSIFKEIISKTYISFIPSSIYITRFNNINYNIIDLYINLENIYIYNFEYQSYTNALNKLINLINLN